MRVLILGQVEVVRPDAERLAIAGPNQRRVLAALALRRNNVVSVTRLVEAVWPDGEPPARAEHSLRTYVHRLRTSLDGDGGRIETVGGGYRLRLAADELDAAEFERLIALANRCAEVGDATGALDAIDAAVELWRGDPFGEFMEERWAAPTASRLRELWNELRATRAEVLIESGRARDAVGLLEELVLEEPLHERSRGLLMRALHGAGRQTEALRAFHDFRRFASEELGIEPSPELVELDRAIARGDVRPTERPTRAVRGYELHERIGVGAFAVVHRATQSALGRDVAVKVIRAELANRAEFIRRFEAEARMVATIEHPNVVPLYDFWREPDRAFLVMRRMTGSLDSRLDDGRVEPADALVIVEQVAAALEAAHRIGVIHRDVKPANILFDDEGRAYIADFGRALASDDWARPETALSEGAPVYAAPEQLRGEPAGPEADVFALATVAATMLAGRGPFAGRLDSAEQLRRPPNDLVPAIDVIAPELPGAVEEVLARGTAEAPDDRYPSALTFAQALRVAFEAMGVADRAVPLRPRQNPYKGLAAFDEADAGDFHGRERLVDEFVDHLAGDDVHMLAVVGPSGSGKSSVVRAGLLPALRGGRLAGSSDWFVTTMIPGARPYEALETALLRIAARPSAALSDQLRDGDRGILRAVRRITAGEGIVVIVIDQFEELFASEVASDERDRFLRALSVAVTETTSPVRIVLTLRADFYDRPLMHPTFAAVLKGHTVVVTPLVADELEDAIATPAASVGVELEPGLVAAIVFDVTSQPGGLPLLQYALTRAFEATDGDVMTTDTYRAIGGITGALADRAEELFAASNAAEQVAMRRAFGRLVAVGDVGDDTRRRALLRELDDDAPTRAVIERLGRERLLTFDHDPATREPTVEVAHEALLREWPRLRQWLDEDRDILRVHRHLSTTAAGWAERDRDGDELYGGSRLEAAESLLTTDTVALTDTETAFLHASRVAADAQQLDERQRTKRFRRLALGLAAALIAVAVAGIAASLQRRSAQRSADEAQRASVEATARRLAVEAMGALDVDPDLAIQLALESFRRTDEAGIEPVEGSIEAIHTVTQASRLLARFDATGAAAIDPSGDLVALARDDAVVVVAATGDEVVATSLGSPVLGLVYHPSDERLIAVTEVSVVLLDGADLDVLTSRTFEDAEARFDPFDDRLVFHPSGDRFAVDHGGVLQVVDAIDLSVVEEVPDVSFVGWSDDDLIVIDGDGVIARVDSAREEHRLDLPIDDIQWAVGDSGGDRLIVLSGGSGHVVALDDPEADPLPIDASFEIAFQRAAMSPDGRSVYAFGPSEEVRVVPLGADGTRSLRGHEGVRRLDVDAGARRLLVVGSEEALLWDLTTEGPAELGAVAAFDWMEFSRDGSIAYVPDEGGHIRSVELATGRPLATGRTVATTNGFGVIDALAPGGLVAGTMAGEVSVVIEDLSTGSTRTVPPCTHPVAIDADGRWMISGRTRDADCDGIVDLRSGELVVREPGGIGLSVIGPPGTIADGMAAYQLNGDHQPTPTLMIRDLATGREIAHADIDMWKPFFSNDGRFITFGSTEHGGVVIDVQMILDGTPIEDAIVLNPKMAGATSFSRVVGDDFVTGHSGEVLRFWRRDDGTLRLALPVQSRDTTYIAPTPDDRYLYYETEGDLFRRFPMQTDDLIALAEQRAQRDVTVDECVLYALSDSCDDWVRSRSEETAARGG